MVIKAKNTPRKNRQNECTNTELKVDVSAGESRENALNSCNAPIKKWSDALEKLSIHIVEIPWNASGAEAVEILRAGYVSEFPCLLSEEFDTLCESIKTLGYDEQLNAIGSLLLEKSLRFGYLAINPLVYKAFIVDKVETRAFQQMWKGILKRHQFFDLVQMFSVARMGKMPLEIRIPLEQIQLQSSVIKRNDARNSAEIRKLGHFLFVQKPILDPMYGMAPQKCIAVYDLTSWPPVETSVKLVYDCDYIEPFCCDVVDSSGKCCRFRGSEFEQLHEDDDLRTNPWLNSAQDKAFPGICLGGDVPKRFPSIVDGEPVLCYSGHVIYLVHRRCFDSDNQRHAPRYEFLLLDYDIERDVWRMMNMHNFVRFDASSLFLYKKEWVLIPNSPYDCDSSYCLRLWNPLANECYRLPDSLLGSHHILQYIPLDDGDILFYLDNGNLCRFNGNLADYLRDNRYRLPIEAWSSEKTSLRRFDRFKSSGHDGLRKTLESGNVIDRYVAVFENGDEVDIAILED